MTADETFERLELALDLGVFLHQVLVRIVDAHKLVLKLAVARSERLDLVFPIVVIVQQQIRVDFNFVVQRDHIVLQLGNLLPGLFGLRPQSVDRLRVST